MTTDVTTATADAHGHHHHTHASNGRVLLWALLLTLGFSLVEVVAGWYTGSLALLSDAGHMVSDGAALGLSALAAWLARRPPTLRHTYGLGRAELLAALVNALSMLLIVFLIAREAWLRLQHPGQIDGATVGIVAVIGLAVNIVVAWLLSRGEQNLNMHAALLHVMGDALGSIAAILAGMVIWLTGWTPIDPLLSLLIGGLILASSLRLLREALHANLDGVPFDTDLEALGKALACVPGVDEVHDLHVWPIGSGRIALTAHVRVPQLDDWPTVLARLRHVAEHQGIGHTTFQPEGGAAAQPIRFQQAPSNTPIPGHRTGTAV